MPHRYFKIICLSLIILQALVLLPLSLSAAEITHSISTGSPTGVYYAAGTAVAKLFNKKRQEYGLRLVTKASEGSIDNINRVKEKEATFGIAQANGLYLAQAGSGPWQGNPHGNLRAVVGLYTEDLTIVTAVKSGIAGVSDLKGKRVNIGAPGSADQITSLLLLKEWLKMDPANDLKVSERPSYEAPELIQQGKIDAFFYTVGHPNLTIIEATAGERKVKMIALDQALIDDIVRPRPFLTATKISVNDYPDLENREDVSTIGVRAILFTRSDTDEETVYKVVREVMGNLDLFRRQHPVFAGIKEKDMTKGLIVPLHPGAERYFREAGLLE